jgi:hypothetical protein
MKVTSWTTIKDYAQIKGGRQANTLSAMISAFMRENKPVRKIEVNGVKTPVWEWEDCLLRKAGGTTLIIEL